MAAPPRAGLIDPAPVVAVDATGLEARHVSAYYHMRRGEARRRRHRRRAWSKLTAVVHVRSHLILSAVTGTRPTQDSPAFTPAVRQAAAQLAPARLDRVLADAAYDAEHNHALCREALGVPQVVIPINPRTHGRRCRGRPTGGISAGAASRALPTGSAGTPRAASRATSGASAPRSPRAPRRRTGASSCCASSRTTS